MGELGSTIKAESEFGQTRFPPDRSKNRPPSRAQTDCSQRPRPDCPGCGCPRHRLDDPRTRRGHAKGRGNGLGRPLLPKRRKRNQARSYHHLEAPFPRNRLKIPVRQALPQPALRIRLYDKKIIKTKPTAFDRNTPLQSSVPTSRTIPPPPQ